MHIRTRFALSRHPVNRAHWLSIHQNHPFIPFTHIWQKLLHDQRFAREAAEQFMQRCHIAIIFFEQKNACAAIAVKRL